MGMPENAESLIDSATKECYLSTQTSLTAVSLATTLLMEKRKDTNNGF